MLKYLKEGLASLENRIQKKRRFSNSDNAYLVKRDRLLQIKELDIAKEQKMLIIIYKKLDIINVIRL